MVFFINARKGTGTLKLDARRQARRIRKQGGIGRQKFERI